MMGKSEALVTIGFAGEGSLPWVMIWHSPRHFTQRAFATREEAVEAARQLSLGSAPFDRDYAVYPAKMPVFTNVPSSRTIEAWIEVADAMLAGLLANRGKT